MASTQWITKRREDVSQILVDSLQKLGNANDTVVRDSVNDLPGQTTGRSVATQVSLSQHTPSGKQPSNSSSPVLISSPVLTYPECNDVVPKLDIASLLNSTEGCKAEGTSCHYACVKCGDTRPASPYCDPEGISVLSAKYSHVTIPVCEEVKTNSRHNGADKEFVDTSSFILYNLNLEGPSSIQEENVEGESSNCEEKLSVLRIYCADPEDLAREEEEMKTSAKLKERKEPAPESRANVKDWGTIDSTTEESITPPFTLTKKEDSEIPLPQCENQFDDHIEPYEEETPPQKPHTSFKLTHQTPSSSQVLNPSLPARHPKPCISPSQADKDRRQSFGFTMKDMGQSMDTLHGTKSSKQSRLKKLFGFGKKQRKSYQHF